MPKKKDAKRTEAAILRAQQEAKKKAEDASLAAQRSEVPTPEEVNAALLRLARTANIYFQVDLGNGWTDVVLINVVPIVNRVNMELTILFFKMERKRPMIMTPGDMLVNYEIDGWLALTMDSLRTMRATLVLGEKPTSPRNVTVGFRVPSGNEDADDWLRLMFAKAQGARFRQHSSVNPSEIQYTRNP